MVERILDVMQSRGLMADEADALAVVEAMRDPTEAMFLARPVYIPHGDAWRQIWEWQIDAILSET